MGYHLHLRENGWKKAGISNGLTTIVEAPVCSRQALLLFISQSSFTTILMKFLAFKLLYII